MEYTEQHDTKQKVPCKYASRRLRDYQTSQQGTFIGLLNNYCDITFIKPPKKAVLTHQFVKIKKISFSSKDVIVLEDFLQKRCGEHKDGDLDRGCSEKTANRRFQTNKKIETLHLLYDILGEFGFFCEVNATKGKKETMKLQNVENVFYQEKYLMGIEEIYTVGFKVNDYLCNLIENKDEITLNRNNRVVQSFFAENMM
ncbi:hypothetical protein EIN_525920 [Entamoeba invadens IP1]|uniref:Uncharacterized protein n=1 Tax=Entamoeba invadens IP1 TaxID=370355 RepID=A0A0A1U5K5_ENTIV|nr:hypothetical protein EIN_525920 [Entamoeba invadens IP1]ELP89597.1 hypothetical protein EIN_525920 [Entamoeba invadens IP1]|eukprot:XP_004256368.1 hypothetical protein EIN_525920 [Entamoeba invadens IP1]